MGKVVDSSIFRVKMFDVEKYERARCKVCGADFWSKIPRDNCNDAPCADYTFFDIKLGTSPLTVKEVRDKFLRFFNERGHTIIDPHPVVARWRDDLYLTIASIVVFQPHVTSGLVPPPANPLVIAQPCIRLEDIDSVGYTFGRHLTNFIMGGHHAFNYPNERVYFTHETVEYAKEFFTKEIGIPEEELTFKESWWEGGGNAGPCFEVAVGGLEIATLVFMMYDVTPEGYREMPLKIVDTGYGIERIAWLTQKTPTAFHAIYGYLVPKYHKLLNVSEPPEDLLKVAVKYVGRLNPKNPKLFELLKKNVSIELGMSLEEVSAYLDRTIKLYALLDYVKTAMLLLSDGVVPSNSGEGYLARLVIRRILRLLNVLGSDATLIHDLFDNQIKYWVDLYPQVRGKEAYIHDVLDHEVRKFNESLSKAPSLIRRYVVKGAKGLSEDELIELYDSHGIPPEVIADLSRELGVEVSVPEDFYNKLAARHSRAPVKKVVKSKIPEYVVTEVAGLPATKALFHEDPYVKEFTAEVVKVIKNYVVLDRTAFYPEGGGQEGDSGVLIVDGRKFKVVDTQKVGSVVIHVLEDSMPADYVGRRVVGVIDWDRRFNLMRHHTATHIILGVARKVLGSHVWQAGAEKTPLRGRLDITHYKSVSEEELKQIEELANKVIVEGREVKVHYMPKYEAEKRYGFVLYEGGVVLEPVIRVVEIEGLDAEACFGTHLKNTREVGALKIVKVERIADGVVRFEYVAGTQVSAYAQELESKIKKAEEVVGGDLNLRIPSLIKELETLKNKLNTYRKLYFNELKKSMYSELRSLGSVRYLVKYLADVEEELLKEVLQELTAENPDAVLIVATPRKAGGVNLEISEGRKASEVIKANELFKQVLTVFKGRGGGKADHATGYVEVENHVELIEVLESLLKNVLKA